MEMFKISRVYHYVWEQLKGGAPLFKYPQFPIVGPSNAGKSTLINSLLGSKKWARVAKTPGKTANIHFFLVNNEFHIVDLPGFGYAKRSKKEREYWKRMVYDYFTKNSFVKSVFFIFDVRRDFSEREILLFDWFVELNIPVVVLLNKADKVKKSQLKARFLETQKFLKENNYDFKCLLISAMKREGIDSVFSIIQEKIGKN